MAKKRTNKVTLRDIAERANVSRMTVSLALRGDPRIKEETRSHIRAIADDMGYSPNHKLSKLMATIASKEVEQGKLGYILSGPPDTMTPMDSLYFESLKKITEQRGYQLEPFSLFQKNLSTKRINEIMWNQGIEGLIISMINPKAHDDGARTIPVKWDKFCVVEIADTVIKPRLNGVRHEHFGGMLRALSELEALGYKRIGFCMEPGADLRTHHRWTGAYLTWRTMRGFSEGMYPYFSDTADAKAVVQWIERESLDAVVSPGLLCLRALESEGVRFPDDLGFACLDCWGEGAKEVTGIDQNVAGQAQIAVDMLINLIHRQNRGTFEAPIRAIDKGLWQHGYTTRPPGKDHKVNLLDDEAIHF